MAQRRHEPDSAKHTHGALLIRVDDHRFGGFATEKGHDAVAADPGPLH